MIEEYLDELRDRGYIVNVHVEMEILNAMVDDLGVSV